MSRQSSIVHSENILHIRFLILILCILIFHSTKGDIAWHFVRRGTTTDIREFDDFSAAETELLVVIQHSVHVLNPHSIHWAIKHVPSLVIIIGSCPKTDHRGENAICPVSKKKQKKHDLGILLQYSMPWSCRFYVC